MSDLGLHVHFFSTTAAGNGPNARGILTVCDAIRINFTLWGNRDGTLRLGLPYNINSKFDESKPVDNKTNKKYYDEVSFKYNEDQTSPARDEVTAFIVDAYEKACSSPSSSSSAGNGSVNKNSTYDDVIPF
jgi:hypothetical protein